jgi:hypothetical protein
MNIKEITVTATATKQYNKFEVSLTAEIIDDNDFETLKNIAINKALSGVDQLVNNSNPSEVEVKTTPVQPPVQRSSYPTAPVQRPAVPNYYANAPQNQPYSPQNVVQQPGVKMASEKQIQLLRKLHVQCDYNNLTAAQANDLIKSVMGDRQQ